MNSETKKTSQIDKDERSLTLTVNSDFKSSSRNSVMSSQGVWDACC